MYTKTKDVQKYLIGVEYPTTKEHLEEFAREKEADEDALNTISMLSDKEYGSSREVEEALKSVNEPSDEIEGDTGVDPDEMSDPVDPEDPLIKKEQVKDPEEDDELDAGPEEE